MRFYVLERHPDVDEVPAVTDFLYADGSPVGEAPRCPTCGAYIGMLPLLPPFAVNWRHGERNSATSLLILGMSCW
jgi:hypothetical protein